MPKPLNVFISYSHKDEAHVDELKKHLVTLRQRDIVADWYDRELISGDSLDEELRSKLTNSDLVLFIISVDFLASWYCYEVELKETLKRVEHGEVRVIPIITRHCKWKDTELSKYVAATRDAKPIVDYQDQDAAWVEVVNSIENAAKEYLAISNRSPEVNLPISLVKEFQFLDCFANKLEDTEVVFSHKHKDRVTLEDIYVYPDLKSIKHEYDEIGKTIRSKDLTDPLSIKPKILILGSEQDGKTSLSKMLTKTYREKGLLPLLCRGNQINSTNLEKLIELLVKEQYSNLSLEQYLSSKSKNAFLIDDYSDIKINVRFQKTFIETLVSQVGIVIITSSNSIKYDEGKYIELAEFDQYELLPFGNVLRGELIEKWNCIGREETIEAKELHDENDRITSHVNSIVRKNVLPKKPIYILTIIQLLETSKPTDYSLTSYGHCYQSLIQANFKKANIDPRDFDTYINYLTELAFHFYNAPANRVESAELRNFKEQYSKQYLIQSHEKVIEKLLISGVLQEKGGFLEFGYRYIYYFYVAKYLSDHLDITNCKKAIEHLFKNMHTEENANILIFLVHHSKDSEIIDEILVYASVVFDGTSEARLDIKETTYLIDYIASIPKLVVEQKDIEKERKANLEKKDNIEKLEEPLSEEGIDNDNDNKILSEINRSARLVEIIGQILRNRYGSLKKEQLKELSLSAYSSGLKFLNFFLTTTREEQEYILDFLRNIFKQNESLTDDDISKEAKNIFLMLCYGTSYSVIKKIANSLGSEKLVPIFNDINENHADSPAMKLIHVAVLLEFTKSIPKKELSELYANLDGNPIAQRLLQELVVQHLYLNHVNYKDRQWISSKIELPIDTQRLIQSKDEYKT